MDDSSDPQKQEGTKSDRIVAILVGAPGSGKTTFCNDVIAAACRSWVRVCQDTIANGKAGTKAQCLRCATDALNDGKSVFIDRCNLERDQRAEFVKLGGEQIKVHAVVLDLPAKLCISRSVKRTGHEGNLQGGKAAAVVNRMLQKKELPKLNEGFSRIMFCHNENDVKEAVKTYVNLGPSDSLPPGIFGQKNPDTKVQLGIMKFLKKVETPTKACDSDKIQSDGNGLSVSASKQESRENDPCSMEIETENEPKEDIQHKDSLEKSFTSNAPSNISIRESMEKDPCSMEIETENEPKEDIQHTNSIEKSFTSEAPSKIATLAFPSISTSDFQFDHGKASDIIVKKVCDFLNMVDNVRLVLVDLSHKSHMLSLVKAKAAKKNIDSSKFFTHVGDITKLRSEGNLHCNVISNAANWRLKPGGGGVNAAIFKAGGKDLEVATKEKADTLSPGSSVSVPLPSTSPLYQREGVTHVIHVLGPNMNPQRPNFLKNDYVKGCKLLGDAYSSLFENFASIVQAQRGESSDSVNIVTEGGNNCHGYNDQKTKRGNGQESDSNKKSKPDENKVVEKQKQHEKNAPKRTWGSWAQALHQIAMHPEKHKEAVNEISDDLVVLNDLYPKAKKHILVLSRLPGLDSLADVRREHIPLLKEMHSAGLKWAERFLHEDPSYIFRLGYHSVPSMRQLHLHVISQDFDSSHLKNKKHWNSFNTPFFRDSTDVIEEIHKTGEATLNDEKLLAMELRCHRCRSAHPNIPRLKSHIANCKASFSSSQLQNGRLVFASS